MIITASIYPLQLQGECQLGSATIILEGGLPTTLQQLPNTLSLQLPASLSVDDVVNVYGAVISQQQQLVKTGEFIEVSAQVSMQ